jgi:transcriptional regulator with XRE-family HTH domain
MPQEILAGLVGRTGDWLGKVENNRIALDRLSMIQLLAEALDIPLAELLTEQAAKNSTRKMSTDGVSALCAALTDYTQLTPTRTTVTEPPSLARLERELISVFEAYQTSRLNFAVSQLRLVLANALSATRGYDGAERRRAHELLALTYQGTATVLAKLGKPDLAWMAAERGFSLAAEQVHRHPVSRWLILTLVRNSRGKPSFELDRLARTMHIIGDAAHE